MAKYPVARHPWSPTTEEELKTAIAVLAPPLCPICHGPLETEVEGRMSWRVCRVKVRVEEDLGAGQITTTLHIYCRGFDGLEVDEARAAASRYQEIR